MAIDDDLEVEKIITNEQLKAMMQQEFDWLTANTGADHPVFSHVYSNGRILFSSNGVQFHALHIPLEERGIVTCENGLMTITPVSSPPEMLKNDEKVNNLLTTPFPTKIYLKAGDLKRALEAAGKDAVIEIGIGDVENVSLIRIHGATHIAVISLIQTDYEYMPGVWHPD